MFKSCTDHLGHEFVSLTAMCKYYNISTSAYKNRIAKGWSIQEALETPNAKFLPESERTDHLGIVYNSVKEMANHYGMALDTYKRRIKAGWSIEMALTEPLDTSKHGKPEVDHLGNEFPMLKDMCKYYGVTVPAYLRRIANGYTKEEALTKCQKNHRTIVDFAGNKFSSDADMCRYYNVKHSTYLYRIRNGYPQQMALDLVPLLNDTNHKNAEINNVKIEYVYTGVNGEFYYSCIFNGIEKILSRTEVIEGCLDG
jgi:hypothetical protein